MALKESIIHLPKFLTFGSRVLYQVFVLQLHSPHRAQSALRCGVQKGTRSTEERKSPTHSLECALTSVYQNATHGPVHNQMKELLISLSRGQPDRLHSDFCDGLRVTFATAVLSCPTRALQMAFQHVSKSVDKSLQSLCDTYVYVHICVYVSVVTLKVAENVSVTKDR